MVGILSEPHSPWANGVSHFDDLCARGPAWSSYEDEISLAGWRGRISSRLARHVAIERRALVNSRPMVSFTFDDAAESAADVGARALESANGRGTYYINTGHLGLDNGDYGIVDESAVRLLHARGHQIGLHSHKHRAVGSVSERNFIKDLEICRERLEAIHPGIRPRDFAYPYGMVNFARKRRLSGLVRSSRGITPGVNAGIFDPQYLKCVELSDQRLTPEQLNAHIDEAVRSKGWLIFLSHDISPRPSSCGCTPELFGRAVARVVELGVEIVTVAAALDRSAVVKSMFPLRFSR